MKTLYEQIQQEKRNEEKGKYLAWAIIHLLLFVSMLFSDLNIEGLDAIFWIIVNIFFGWRFIENTKMFFKFK